MRRAHRLEEVVFWYVFDRPASLRSDLSHQFGISPATVSRVVSGLLDHGLLIEELRAETASPGRKPQSLQINPKLAFLLGLDIQLDGVLAVVTDMAGTLLGRGAVRCSAEQGVDTVLRASRKAAEVALEDAAIDGQIGHLGAGLSGDLDITKGECVSWANAPAWQSVPIRAMLEEVFGLAVTIDDRSRALALAERHKSPEDWGHTEAIYIVCASGVGMGFFVDGRLHRGASGGGGEIGHTVIDPKGPPCRCGNRGCVEAFSGTVSILQHVQDAVAAGANTSLRGAGADLALRTVAAAAQRGDPVASAALDRAAGALGIAVANIVQVLNPSLVVLCGQLALAAGPRLLGAVRAAVGAQSVKTAAHRVKIRLARPKKDISAIGCALLAAEAEAARVLEIRLSESEKPADAKAVRV